jgi:hypothetical protein
MRLSTRTLVIMLLLGFAPVAIKSANADRPHASHARPDTNLSFNKPSSTLSAADSADARRATITQTDSSLPRGLDPERVIKTLDNLPLSFEPNVGQTDEQVKFLARGNGYTLFLTPREAVFSLGRRSGSDTGRHCSGFEDLSDPLRRPLGNLPFAGGNPQSQRKPAPPAVLRMKLDGARPDPEVVGLEELPRKTNYFIGNDPGNWRTHVANYRSVVYRSIYPGVDLVYRGEPGGLEYDFVLAPGTSPNTIKLAFEGAEDLKVYPDGSLVIQTSGGEVLHRKPLVYQESGERRIAVDCHYRLEAGGQVGFEVAAFDPALSLTIDPVLIYSGQVGGSGAEAAYAIAADEFERVFLAGTTTSLNLPTRNAYQDENHGAGDAFVTKLNLSGSEVEYSTYFGGSDLDIAYGMAISGPEVWLTGMTLSDDFPVYKPIQRFSYEPIRPGKSDAFVVGLNSGGGDTIFLSTYFGGPEDDYGTAIAISSYGGVFITGAAGRRLPTSFGAFQTSAPGGGGAFVAKISFVSTLIYATYLGGSTGKERGSSIAVDADGSVYVTGITASGDFPTQNALQAKPGRASCTPGPDGSPCYDAFVTKINVSGTTLLWSTFLGGSTDDIASKIALDAQGNIIVAGFTQSTDFPVVKPLQARNAGGWDGFVSKISPTGQELLFSTYLGGSGDDYIAGVALPASGTIYLAGDTRSNDFPVAGALQAKNAGGSDIFLTQLSTAGDQLLFSSYLGGSGDDYGSAVAIDIFEFAYVTGRSNSTDFPLAGAGRSLVTAGATHAIVAKAKIDTRPPPPSFALRTVVNCNGWRVKATAFNDQGTVVFAGGSIGSPADGIVLVTPDRFQKFVRAGDPVPGIAGGYFTGFSTVEYDSAAPALNNQNAVAFVGFFRTDSTPAYTSLSGLFLYSDGAIRKIAASGETSQDCSACAFGNFQRVWINDAGMILFESSIHPGGLSQPGLDALFLYRDEKITRIGSTHLPSLLPQVFFDNFGNATSYEVSSDTTAILRTSNGSVAQVISSQDASRWGGSFSNIFGLAANFRGDVVFQAQLSSSFADSGFFVRWSDGSLEQIIAEGDPTPIGGTYRLWYDECHRGICFKSLQSVRPNINNVGSITFSAQVIGGSSSYGGFNFQNGKISSPFPQGYAILDDTGQKISAAVSPENDLGLGLFLSRTRPADTIEAYDLFMQQADRIARVASANQPTPGSDTEFFYTGIEGYKLNGSGEVLIQAGTCCSQAVEGLFVASPRHPSAPNGDFETAGAYGLPAGWEISWVNTGHGDVSLYSGSDSNPYTGKSILRLHAATGGGSPFVVSDSIPIDGGIAYLLTARWRYKFQAESDAVFFTILQFDAAGKAIALDELQGARRGNYPNWEPKGVLFHTRPEAVSIRVRFGLISGTDSYLDIDAVR